MQLVASCRKWGTDTLSFAVTLHPDLTGSNIFQSRLDSRKSSKRSSLDSALARGAVQHGRRNGNKRMHPESQNFHNIEGSNIPRASTGLQVQYQIVVSRRERKLSRAATLAYSFAGIEIIHSSNTHNDESECQPTMGHPESRWWQCSHE